jgi:predicted RNase H-like HicB family nuclease
VPDSDGTFRAEIIEFPGCIAVGDTAAEALAHLEDVAASWLVATLAKSQRVPEPIVNVGDSVVSLWSGCQKRYTKKPRTLLHTREIFLSTLTALRVDSRQLLQQCFGKAAAIAGTALARPKACHTSYVLAETYVAVCRRR